MCWTYYFSFFIEITTPWKAWPTNAIYEQFVCLELQLTNHIRQTFDNLTLKFDTWSAISARSIRRTRVRDEEKNNILHFPWFHSGARNELFEVKLWQQKREWIFVVFSKQAAFVDQLMQLIMAIQLVSYFYCIKLERFSSIPSKHTSLNESDRLCNIMGCIDWGLLLYYQVKIVEID